jgi:hypothetical protein
MNFAPDARDFTRPLWIHLGFLLWNFSAPCAHLLEIFGPLV